MNEKLPAISVIIPMFNMEKYIEQCLDSVLTQTFTDYEVIVADDCSTDRSVELVEKIISDRLTQGGDEKIFGSSSCLRTRAVPLCPAIRH